MEKGRNPHWHNWDGVFLCHRCYNNYVWNPINNPTARKRQLNYKNKRIILSMPLRKGICDLCKKKIGDLFIAWQGKIKIIKYTHIHHLKYHDDDPLKDTIEVCNSCHFKETWKSRRNAGLSRQQEQTCVTGEI